MPSRRVLRTARIVVVAGLAVDAYVHLDLASTYAEAGGIINEGVLFCAEAVAAMLAALVVAIYGSRISFLAGFGVAASALAAMLVSRYVDLGAIGPFPDLYDPVWFGEKNLAAVAEGLASLAALIGFILMGGAWNRRENMGQACAGWRGEIGAYIVGALDAGARAAVRRHLRTCPICRTDYHDLVPVRDWLARLTPADGSGAGRRPGGPPLQPVWSLRQLALPRWLTTAAAVTAAVAVALLTAVLAQPGTSAFQAADRVTGVHGQARLRATAAGTEIALTVSGLRPGERCVLVAVSPDTTDIAATWTAANDGTARITGTSAIAADQLSVVRVESAAHHLMLSINVASAAGG